MKKSVNPNITIIELAVAQLEELVDEMVFLGGCATGLLITDLAAPPIRVTRDVDAIVQVVSSAEYYQLAYRLQVKGFKVDTSEGAPICRWKTDAVYLDIMPTNEKILGFGNLWYEQAMKHAKRIILPSGKSIRIVSAPYFLITKLEAFKGRGNGDFLLSHDIEDIIALLDGRKGLAQEIKQSNKVVREELKKRFQQLVMNSYFIEAVYGHMPSDAVSQNRVKIILKTIRNIADIA